MSFTAIRGFFVKNGTKILTISGVLGFGASAVTTGFATKKAINAIMQEEIRLGRDLTKKEKFKVGAPYFIVPVLLGIGSGGAVIASMVKMSKTEAQLLNMVTSGQASLLALKDEIKSAVGETKADLISREAIKDTKPPVQEIKEAQVTVSDEKLTLFYDTPSEREYWSTYQTVMGAFASIAIRLPEEMFIDWNDLFEYIDAPQLKPLGRVGRKFGFNIDKERNIMPKIYSDFDEDRGIPVTYVEYTVYEI